MNSKIQNCLKQNHFRTATQTQIMPLHHTDGKPPDHLPSFLTGETENRDAFHFAGMFRITNLEFLPEYRQKESREFLSVARTVQQVVRWWRELGESGKGEVSGGGMGQKEELRKTWDLAHHGCKIKLLFYRIISFIFLLKVKRKDFLHFCFSYL